MLCIYFCDEGIINPASGAVPPCVFLAKRVATDGGEGSAGNPSSTSFSVSNSSQTSVLLMLLTPFFKALYHYQR